MKRLVIDGQQRLTTLQLLIKATEQAYQRQDDNLRVQRLQGLTANQKSHWGQDVDNQTKIRQSNSHDQMAFQDVIRDQYNDNQRQASAISDAYGYFRAEVAKWLDEQPENRTERADALEETLTKHLKIAVIDLDEDQKPHIIFETLNDRRESLTQADLIKNTVMYEAKVVDDALKARELWGMFDADEWWRKNSPDDKLKRSHVDKFLYYWIVMRTLRDVSPKRVASEFREYLKEKIHEQSTVETITKEIKRAGKIYQHMEKNSLSEIEIFLKRVKAIELRVVTPLILWLFTSEVPPEQRKRSIWVLESYVVRRMLCGLTLNLNKVFINLLERLNRDDSINADSTIIDDLSSKADSYVWPNDQMLRKNLLVRPMKGPTRIKMVLEAIEMNLRTDKSEQVGRTDELTVEHIMPQDWEASWPRPESTSTRNEDEVESRNQYIRTIGNLTLITGKLNSDLSNRTWFEKREKLYKHSSLFLNKTLLDDAPDVWDEDAITERSKYLAEIICQIWPSADRFAESAA